MQSDKPIITPFWCVEASIIEDRTYGHNGSLTRKGTKHFVPGALVVQKTPETVTERRKW